MWHDTRTQRSPLPCYIAISKGVSTSGSCSSSMLPLNGIHTTVNIFEPFLCGTPQPLLASSHTRTSDMPPAMCAVHTPHYARSSPGTHLGCVCWLAAFVLCRADVGVRHTLASCWCETHICCHFLSHCASHAHNTHNRGERRETGEGVAAGVACGLRTRTTLQAYLTTPPPRTHTHSPTLTPVLSAGHCCHIEFSQALNLL